VNYGIDLQRPEWDSGRRFWEPFGKVPDSYGARAPMPPGRGAGRGGGGPPPFEIVDDHDRNLAVFLNMQEARPESSSRVMLTHRSLVAHSSIVSDRLLDGARLMVPWHAMHADHSLLRHVVASVDEPRRCRVANGRGLLRLVGSMAPECLR
jgi:hypothetical protein